jgi:hypothetical protein
MPTTDSKTHNIKIYTNQNSTVNAQNRHTHQENRIKYCKTIPFIYSQWISTKEVKVYVGEMEDSSVSISGETGYLHAKYWNLTPITPLVQ